MSKRPLGLLTAILGHMSFHEVIEYAASRGIRSLEVACWPKQKEQRRYAGTSHIDVEHLTEASVQEIKSLLHKYQVSISSLGYYPNPLDPNLEISQAAIQHLYRLIDASAMLEVNMITTFIGRNKSLSLSENLDLFEQTWRPIVAYAKTKNVRIAIENCPMWFTYDEYPGGLNLATSPDMFEEMFARIPLDNFGLNFDPSHFVWQQMDYISVLKPFQDRIFHIHLKDVSIDREKLNHYGILVPPLKYMSPKLPGLGDIHWARFLQELDSIHYRGHTVIEFEDKAFESSFEAIDQGIQQTISYLNKQWDAIE